jgi:DNA polymerase-3 subunit delta'
VGKETTALEFAAALFCEAGGLEGCGECRACRTAAGLAHPDIHLIFPAPRDAKPDEIGEVLAAYVKDGYREGDFGRKAVIISVETVLSELVTKSNQRPYVGPWKAFVIADADLATTEAANTLLKTLEEPPAKTVIILCTSRPSALPATVVSRCQKVPFSRLSSETIEEILIADPRLGFDKKSAKAAAALAQGSVGRAVRTDPGALEAELDRIAALMTGRRASDVRSLVDEANMLAFRLGREEQARVLDLMLLWFRDVLAVASAGEADPLSGLLYFRHLPELRAQGRALDFETLESMIRRIDEARRAIERYSNPTIVFTSVLLNAAIARKNAGARRGGVDAA